MVSNKKIKYGIIGALIICIGLCVIIYHQSNDDTSAKGKVPKQLITYDIPNNYKIEEKACYSTSNHKVSSYNCIDNDVDYLEIMASGPSVEATIEKSIQDNAESYKTKNNIDGYIYNSKDNDKLWCFTFIKDKYVYSVTSTNKDDLIKVIETIK